ncbi:hypothetical protein RBA41_21215 [Massilia sp. CCM 9210]|uniref:hypothetical protein n=1 Tax=Massilia scottii TaxID=3057166 RepID=UPI002796D4B7|nr:hypothetical protein [Massilia sp. CCM 9210]MDQ1815820.1 hypothetical protein [Massilia sp. CCM 9210]
MTIRGCIRLAALAPAPVFAAQRVRVKVSAFSNLNVADRQWPWPTGSRITFIKTGVFDGYPVRQR